MNIEDVDLSRDELHPIKLNINTLESFLELRDWAKLNNISFYKTIDEQIKEYEEIFTASSLSGINFEDFLEQKLGSHLEVAGEFVYFGWGERAVFQLLPEDMHYELITWRNKEKITDKEQDIISKACVGVVGSSVGSFATKVLTKLGVKNIKIAELKNMKPSNAPRLYVDSIRGYGKHKLSPLAHSLYEFNPFLKLETYLDGFTPNNADEFFGINSKKIDALIDAADDAGTKILLRELCSRYKIPLITGFDEKGCIIIERFDFVEHKMIAPNFTIAEVEELKSKSVQDYAMKLLEYFPGGFDNLSERQKLTISRIFKQERGGFSQLSFEASLFGAMISKSVLDIILGERISGVLMLDLDELITKDMSARQTSPFKLAE